MLDCDGVHIEMRNAGSPEGEAHIMKLGRIGVRPAAVDVGYVVEAPDGEVLCGTFRLEGSRTEDEARSFIAGRLHDVHGLRVAWRQVHLLEPAS
ncbi:hypothetical protein PSD17_64360 [Pseudonocardia sp. D17]|nr:hypothetical protein PSD17_64360 [Pseudonocardia sp. D17]